MPCELEHHNISQEETPKWTFLHTEVHCNHGPAIDPLNGNLMGHRAGPRWSSLVYTNRVAVSNRAPTFVGTEHHIPNTATMYLPGKQETTRSYKAGVRNIRIAY